MDYGKARDLVERLAGVIDQEEQERVQRLEGENPSEEDRQEAKEEAVKAELTKEVIETAGELLIDIAENLNKIAGGQLSSGRRM